jgi:hypothetical protein
MSGTAGYASQVLGRGKSFEGSALLGSLLAEIQDCSSVYKRSDRPFCIQVMRLMSVARALASE